MFSKVISVSDETIINTSFMPFKLLRIIFIYKSFLGVSPFSTIPVSVASKSGSPPALPESQEIFNFP